MSISVEGQQIALRLTTNKDVLEQLRRNKSLVKDENGEEVLTLQFNSQTFEFRHGNTIALGRSTAKALVRNSAVIVGDPNDPDYQITGDFLAGLDEVRSFDIGKGQAENVCTFCSETTDANGNLFTPSTLGYHMMHKCPQAAKVTAEMKAAEEPQPEPKGWQPPPKTLAKSGPKPAQPAPVAPATTNTLGGSGGVVSPGPGNSKEPANEGSPVKSPV